MLSIYMQAIRMQNFKAMQFFGCMNGQKAGKGDDDTIVNSNFWHF